MLEGLFSSAGHFARDLSDIAHRTTAAAGLLVEILEDPRADRGTSPRSARCPKKPTCPRTPFRSAWRKRR
jgi:hypothetical protein